MEYDPAPFFRELHESGYEGKRIDIPLLEGAEQSGEDFDWNLVTEWAEGGLGGWLSEELNSLQGELVRFERKDARLLRDYDNGKYAYLFKVWLQKKYEAMVLGRQSVKILKGDTRTKEEEDSEEMMTELAKMLYLEFEEIFSGGKLEDKDLRHLRDIYHFQNAFRGIYVFDFGRENTQFKDMGYRDFGKYPIPNWTVLIGAAISIDDIEECVQKFQEMGSEEVGYFERKLQRDWSQKVEGLEEVELESGPADGGFEGWEKPAWMKPDFQNPSIENFDADVGVSRREALWKIYTAVEIPGEKELKPWEHELGTRDVLWRICRTIVECIVSEARRKVTTYKDREKRTRRRVKYSLPGVVLLRKLIGKLMPILGEATGRFGNSWAGYSFSWPAHEDLPETGLLDGKDESIEELFRFIDPEENNPFIKRFRHLTDTLDLKTTYQETMVGGMMHESHFGGTKGKGRRSSKWGEWPFDVRREFVLEHNVLRFSSNLLNLLVIKGWIHIDNGEFQDVVDFFGESEDDVVHRELNWQGSPPNMIRFGPVLNKILVLPHMEDEHAIFRTLRQNPKRWMYCQPEPHLLEWERHGQGRNLGGYLSRGLRNSIMSSSQYERMAKLEDQLGRSEFPIRTELGSDTRRALNHLQNTQWEVNLDFVEVIAAAHDSDGYVFRQPIREQAVQWKGFGFRPWLESSREREDSGRLGEKWEKWDHTLNNVRKAIRNVGNVFWHPWACDWRGRLYSSTAQMSPIGDDLDKALIRFKEWKPLGKKGIFWLRVHACNLMNGVVWRNKLAERTQIDCMPAYEWKNHRSASNKVSFKERNQWTIDNIDTLRGIAQGFCREKVIDAGFTPDEEFLNILGLDKQPRSGDDAFQRLAVLLELDRVYSVFDTVKDWDKVTSGQPVYLDASCNGFQHAAALLRDGSLAKSVNVLRNEDNEGDQSDLYQEVASFAKRAYKNVDVKTSLRLEIESNPGLYGEPGRWERIFTRKLMKGPTMVYTYGAKDLEKCFVNRDGKGEPGWRQLEPLTVEGVKEYPSRCQKFRKGTFGKEQQEECGVVFNSKQEYVEHMNSKHGWAVRLHPNSPLRDEISKGGVWNVWMSGRSGYWKEAKGLVKIDIEFDEWKMMVDEQNSTWPDHVEDAMMRVARKLTRDVQTAIDCVTDDAYEKLGLRTLVKTQKNCEPRGEDDWINEATMARKKQLDDAVAGLFTKVGGGKADWDKLRLYSMGWRNHMCWTAGPIVLNQVKTKDEVDGNYGKYLAPKYGSHGIPTHTVITNMHAELGEKDRPRAWKLFDIVDEDKISKAELVRRISSFLDEMNIQIHGVEDAITIGKENQDSTGKPHYDEKMERVIGRMQNKLRDLYYNSKEQSVVEKSKEFLLRLSNRKKITISSLEGVSHDGKVRDKGSSTPGSKARRRGVTPQFIHSHDAAHMVMTICGLADNNIDDIWIVHDCFGAHACHIDSLLSVVNESFVNLHKNENFGDKLLQIDPWFNLHGQDGFYDYGMTDNGKMHVLVLQESQKPLHELSRGELIHELQKRRIPWDGNMDDNDLISRLVRMYFNYRFSIKLLLHSVKVTRDKSGGAAEIFMDEVSEKEIDKYDARGGQILIKLMNSADCKDAYFDYLVMKREIELALYVIATMGQKAVREPPKRKLSNLEDARKFRQNHDWLNAAKEILLIKPTLEPLIEAKEKFEQITGEHLRGMTVVELQKQLKDFGLKTTGNKGDLISRLVRYELRNDRSMLPPSHRNLGRDNDVGEIEMLDIKDAINAEFLIS